MHEAKLTFLFLFLVFGSLLCRGSQVRKSRRDGYVSIINPNYTDVTNFPYTVSVAWNSKQMGGGVLVSKRWVLTAAYNVDGFIPSEMRVRVGSNVASSGGELYRVSKVVQHPNYTGEWTSDLSLLKLSTKVSTKYGKPVALATSAFQGNTTGIITGYGNTTTVTGTSEDSSLLEVATIQVFDNVTCNGNWYKEADDELSAGELCGYAVGTGPCTLDFGDPLVECVIPHSCTLVGMFAGGYGCADDHYPGIYTDVGYFYHWISDHIDSTSD